MSKDWQIGSNFVKEPKIARKWADKYGSKIVKKKKKKKKEA